MLATGARAGVVGGGTWAVVHGSPLLGLLRPGRSVGGPMIDPLDVLDTALNPCCTAEGARIDALDVLDTAAHPCCTAEAARIDPDEYVLQTTDEDSQGWSRPMTTAERRTTHSTRSLDKLERRLLKAHDDSRRVEGKRPLTSWGVFFCD